MIGRELSDSDLEARVDMDKAVSFAHKVIRMVNENHYPFNRQGVFPDAVVPRNLNQGGSYHALYLFFTSFLTIELIPI